MSVTAEQRSLIGSIVAEVRSILATSADATPFGVNALIYRSWLVGQRIDAALADRFSRDHDRIIRGVSLALMSLYRHGFGRADLWDAIAAARDYPMVHDLPRWQTWTVARRPSTASLKAPDLRSLPLPDLVQWVAYGIAAACPRWQRRLPGAPETGAADLVYTCGSGIVVVTIGPHPRRADLRSHYTNPVIVRLAVSKRSMTATVEAVPRGMAKATSTIRGLSLS